MTKREEICWDIECEETATEQCETCREWCCEEHLTDGLCEECASAFQYDPHTEANHAIIRAHLGLFGY